ncbi:type II toxin-antitoxin system RelE/ParE family toxin [Urbifossiella limnaea]|uniref:Plasmid stabilization system protein n=1 Tax=Urbifossiella limnaea TaxID=2528023 RepID=A0A517XMU3_9BACT|nr:type II toxin-antitoxin system RelE/ParE family toxin [Urbifossiella limnaea]QDU18823.1 Plasmid stabilization system protein [Urbifossiella limnaea]
MSLPVVVRPEADDDIVAARAWYDEQGAGLGARFAARLAAVIDRLSDVPELYGEVGPGVRAATVARFPYVVYYRPFADRVEVLAVLHGSRDPAAWQGRA